jgi:hypothetical protein
MEATVGKCLYSVELHRVEESWIMAAMWKSSEASHVRELEAPFLSKVVILWMDPLAMLIF